MTESEKTTIVTIKQEIDSDSEANDPNYQHVTDRRTLRTRYLAVKNLIFGNIHLLFVFFRIFLVSD